MGITGRRTRGVRRTALLLVIGLRVQRKGLIPRPRSSRREQDEDDLHAALEAERGRADRLERQLRAAQHDVERAMARVNDLFWTVELRGDGEVMVTHLSADGHGVIGGDVRDGLDAVAFREGWTHPDDAEISAAFTAAMKAGQAAEIEERIVGVDGVVRWTWTRGVPRREGDRLFYDGVTTNITERHALDEQREALLRREQEQVATLEEMHRTRDDFIALAGHELRTPLTLIQGYTESMLEDESVTPEQRAQLEIVVRRARSMSDLIDDLFDLARLDAPLLSVALVPVRLDELARESVTDHQEMARQRGILMEVTTVPTEVTGDAPGLRRMVDAVIDNAVKFSPAGGRIVVRLEPDGDETVFRVTDEGIGIPPEELDRVLDRLYRATNAVDERYPGTGLGLSLAQATAASHGGTTTVENAVGGGAVVTIRLPASHLVAECPGAAER